MNNFFRVVIMAVILLLQACSHEPNIKGGHLVTIETHSLKNSLYYSGIVQPLQTIVIPSPADGVVIDMPFQYGQQVRAGQLLFLISSTKFVSDYKSALTQFVKAKSEFDNSKNELSEAKFLHKNELISDDQFKMKQSSFYANQLSLLEARDTLENLLRQLNIKGINLDELSISDIDKITKALHLQDTSDNLRILSPATGIVLSPNKGEDETKKIMKGDAVKQSDALAIIGDMSGLTVRVKINELTVNLLKEGQKVIVTGIAFPEYSLHGEIKRVDRQGDVSSSGLPTFAVEIVVPTLTPAQQKIIHAGMSVKVEINIEEEPQITVPVQAIKDKNGVSYVQVYDDQSGKLKDVQVVTGKTTADLAAIVSGLKAGDKVFVADQIN